MLSKKGLLQEKCQQLRKIETAIVKINEDLVSIDCTGDMESYFDTLQELACINRGLGVQRHNCREAIILLSMEVYS